MRLWRGIGSRIGMLWIEIAPNAVVTPSSASAWARRSPTGSASGAASGERAVIDVIPSHVPRGAARNLELGAGDEARGRRAEKGDGARNLLGPAEPFQRNLAGAGDLGIPFLARLRRVLADREAALPLAGIDQAEHHRVDADARRELARQRFD